MENVRLSPESILDSYDAVSRLYPAIPPLSLWRAWEHAAYRRYILSEPVLDIGCGDGQFFRLVWPQVRQVTGVDQDPQVVDVARRSGVYMDVWLAAADR